MWVHTFKPLQQGLTYLDLTFDIELHYITSPSVHDWFLF